MRISDWSSDVCSSDLQGRLVYTSKLQSIFPAAAHSRNAFTICSIASPGSRSEPCVLTLRWVDSFTIPPFSLPFPRRPRSEGSIFRSEEHTSELQSLMRISYAVFCLKKKKHKS